MVIWLMALGFHRNRDGSLSRRRLASVFLLSASAYTFTVAACSDLFFQGPSLSLIVSDGFGNQRVAWLLVGVVLDSAFRIWDEFRPVTA